MNMNLRLSLLSERCVASYGREVYEPRGQDGYSCQLLAALYHIYDADLAVFLPAGFSVAELRSRCRKWLIDNATLIVADWKHHPDVYHQELSMLCDYGSEYLTFIENDRAQGNHVVALAICGVLSELTGREIRLQACCLLW